MHDFPAGRFAVWATAWLSGRASYDDALDALTGDTAHRVSGLPGTDDAVPLGWALTALRGLGERRFRLVLPVPGDVRGLPAVPGLAALALEAGQAAVGERLALVPEALGPEVVAVDGVRPGRRPAGRTARRGHRCARCPGRWTWPSATPPARSPGSTSPAGTPRCRRCSPGSAGRRRRPALPDDHDPLALSVLGRAQRLAAVLDLAMADAPGAAVNHAQAAGARRGARAPDRRRPRGDRRRDNWIPREPSPR